MTVKIAQMNQYVVGQAGDLAGALTNKGKKSYGDFLKVSSSSFLFSCSSSIQFQTHWLFLVNV